ncbi:MAG: hypothetical protein ACI4PV_01860, partial [Butyricicoccus sp.]
SGPEPPKGPGGVSAPFYKGRQGKTGAFAPLHPPRFSPVKNFYNFLQVILDFCRKKPAQRAGGGITPI